MLKAVVLAAGNGIRMQPLTSIRPKPLLKVLGETVIEHNLNQLKGLVKEVIIVVGYKGEMIKTLIGDKYQGMKISYVVQTEQLGTGDAARKASVFLDDKFILLNGDDLYFRQDIKRCLKKYPSILVGRVSDPSCFGVIEHNKEFVRNIMEKPERFPLNALVNTGLHYLDKSVFDSRIEKSPRGEYEFTDYVRGFILNERLRCVEAERWLPLSYPWNLLEANENLLEGIRRDIKGTVEKNCNIKGGVVVSQGAVIKSGTYIEGPVFIMKNSVVGPNSFIRGKTVIGVNSRIGNGVEVKNSVIGDNVRINHLSYVGDSVIDEGSNLGAGTIIANQRFDSKNVRVPFKETKIDTNRSKFGAVIGANANIGVNSSLMPGTIIDAEATVMPLSLIKDRNEQ